MKLKPYVLQTSKFGGILTEEDETHIWMVPFLIGIGPKSMDFSKYMLEVEMSLPILDYDWHEFLKAAKGSMSANFLTFVMILAGGLAAFHYQKLLAILGECFSKHVFLVQYATDVCI